MSTPLRFEISARCNTTAARVARVHTPHGWFDTPAFMPVGTKASIKGLTPDHVVATGSQIILNNAYHLMLRPGDDLIARFGGVHRFMQWNGPILTDSGGYQAFSMSGINSIDDDGVTFASIIDGAKIHLSPERAIQVQNNLGADIIMAFDDCPPAGEDIKREKDADHRLRLRHANERTIRWLERCVRAHARKSDQALFGIVQGGTDEDLRRESAQAVCNIDLSGYAIGGVAVGESPEMIHRVVQVTAPLLPDQKPRYLMGVGYERDIVTAVKAGVDMFDCVLPTRNGRNANVFTSTGRIHLTNSKYREDASAIEEGCDCLACIGGKETEGWGLRNGSKPLSPQSSSLSLHSPGFSRAYLRHLFMSSEMLGPILATIHNIRHFQRLMLDIRRAIRENDWLRFDRAWPVARLDAAALAEDQPDAPTTV